MTTAAPFNAASQALRTRFATVKVEKEAVLKLPGMPLLLQQIADRLRWPLELVSKPHQLHILCQDEDLQAGFDWHTDGRSIRISRRQERRLLSLAVQLSSSAASSMWVHGFRPQVYSGQGACVLFHGGCLHRTLPWASLPKGGVHRNIIKLVLFYTDIEC